MAKVKGISLGLIISLALLVLLSGCSDAFVRTRVEIPLAGHMDFSQFSSIVLGEFPETVTPAEIKKPVSIRQFFVRELPSIIGKPVSDRPEITKSPDLSNLLSGTLLITGSLAAEMKERSSIDEKRTRFGDRIRSFKKIRQWKMTLHVSFVDCSSGKEIRKEKITRELKDTQADSSEFNYKKIYNKITDLLLRRIMQKAQSQDRFLLKE